MIQGRLVIGAAPVKGRAGQLHRGLQGATWRSKRCRRSD